MTRARVIHAWAGLRGNRIAVADHGTHRFALFPTEEMARKFYTRVRRVEIRARPRPRRSPMK